MFPKLDDLVLEIWKQIFWGDIQQNSRCSGCVTVQILILGEKYAQARVMLWICIAFPVFLCLLLPVQQSLYAKGGTVLHPPCEEALLFPKAVFLGCFENMTLCWLLVSVGLGIIIRSVPPGEGVPVAGVAGCRYKYHSPSRQTDCFLQLKAVGCLQTNVALETSNYKRVHFPPWGS